MPEIADGLSFHLYMRPVTQYNINCCMWEDKYSVHYTLQDLI